MNDLVYIIEKHIGTFNHETVIDSYAIAERIKKILHERGYVMVENLEEADEYFAKKYGAFEPVYDIEEHEFNKTIEDVTYRIKLHRYFFNADRVYSVLVSEL